LVDKIRGGAYSDEQYYKSLSSEDKRRVQKYRDEARKKKKDKRKIARTRESWQS
jgi:hypothetical protein